jgi:hypothetical protein
MSLSNTVSNHRARNGVCTLSEREQSNLPARDPNKRSWRFRREVINASTNYNGSKPYHVPFSGFRWVRTILLRGKTEIGWIPRPFPSGSQRSTHTLSFAHNKHASQSRYYLFYFMRCPTRSLASTCMSGDEIRCGQLLTREAATTLTRIDSKHKRDSRKPTHRFHFQRTRLVMMSASEH